MPLIKVGCDPEAFIRDKRTGKLVSAHDLLPGTKEKPFKVPGGAIQVDGTAAEFNIDPATGSTDFYIKIQTVLKAIRERLGENYELVFEPVGRFDKEYFDKLPKSATELGCNPDFNAWTGTVNPPPDASGDMYGVRTASGHVHLGWTEDQDPTDPSHIADCNLVAQNLDYFLGLPSLMWDRDNTRRKLYGRAGAVRYKPYGVEYRVLSNRWVADKALTQYVFTSAYSAVNSLFQNQKPMGELLGDKAVEILDENQMWWIERSSKVFKTMSNYVNFPPDMYWSQDKKEAPTIEKKVANHKYGRKTYSSIELDNNF